MTRQTLGRITHLPPPLPRLPLLTQVSGRRPHNRAHVLKLSAGATVWHDAPNTWQNDSSSSPLPRLPLPTQVSGRRPHNRVHVLKLSAGVTVWHDVPTTAGHSEAPYPFSIASLFAPPLLLALKLSGCARAWQDRANTARSVASPSPFTIAGLFTPQSSHAKYDFKWAGAKPLVNAPSPVQLWKAVHNGDSHTLIHASTVSGLIGVFAYNGRSFANLPEEAMIESSTSPPCAIRTEATPAGRAGNALIGNIS
ncbi:hypothetical protein BC629DRAFT_1444549 [Irpex lacteus]|nr:hypothetical protein BC629DRAFT_1444549 [Irpex lacteus]